MSKKVIKVVSLNNQDILKSFQVDLRNFVETTSRIAYHLHIPSNNYIDSPYYEFEWIVEDLVNILEEKNNSNKDSNSRSNEQFENMKSSTNQYQKNAYKQIKQPKMPSMKGFKIPKY